MGLDMYLYARKYDSCGSWKDDYQEKKVGFYPEELKKFEESVDKRSVLSKITEYKIGYWRKANAIHKWFVDNCGEGIDECQPIYVSLDDIKNLRNHCDVVLKDHSKTEELLPTESGFFFGTTDYDGWYYQDLEYTRDLLQKILDSDLSKDYDFIYQASW